MLRRATVAAAAALAGLALLFVRPAEGGLPSVRDSLTHPVHVYEGDDALVTCVVRDAEDNTVLWKKEDRERHSLRVLTAGEARVTADRRFDVLHDAVPPEEKISSGGDVWVLVVKEAKPSDAGIYVCEVNSNPVVRSFHKLSVLSRALQLPSDNASSSASASARAVDPLGDNDAEAPRRHNYTTCCATRNVSQNCFGFCDIQSILDGNTGTDPERCEGDFPDIVSCMADGRNHVPCCAKQRVPDICQDVCRGEYTIITDNIKTHFSCAAYTEPTLACIADGVELLPSPPEDVEAEPLTEHSLNVSWAPPRAVADSVTTYLVNVTLLNIFDEDYVDPDGLEDVSAESYSKVALAASPLDEQAEAEARASSYLRATLASSRPVIPFITSTTTARPEVETSHSLTIPGTYSSMIVNDLQPFAMYEVRVVARNQHGESLPSYAVRTTTLPPGAAAAPVTAPAPEAAPPLPDVRECCASKGIAQPRCLNKLCDPTATALVEVPDLMVCAPWAMETFSCLTNGMDHSPCCRARGLPPPCLDLCSGNVTQIDFSYFNCLKFMGSYSSCLLQGYGVLPSIPRHVHVSHVDTTFALVHWAAPLTRAETVREYAVRWRPLDTYDNEYRAVRATRQPFVLEGLRPDGEYEVYVEAVNGHGAGPPSSRVVFHTETEREEAQAQAALFHNVTACCVEAGLSGVCLPLCTYDASMADVKALAGVCAGELSKLVRCGAGGRDHAPCCARRGVPSACSPVCAGVLAGSLAAAVTTCAPYVGNIVQCFEEGAGLLPGPVEELHATRVASGSTTLQWEPPRDGSNVTYYEVHYQKEDNTSVHETLSRLEHRLNVTNTSIEVTDLAAGGLYTFFVVARNAHGSSLPSAMLLLNVTPTETSGRGIAAVTSPPHSLAVSSHSATWLTLSWQPPEFSHPSEQISYRLYHKAAADADFQGVATSVTSHMLEELLPNTQYIVYVAAVTLKGISLPSETLIAWTDPAYPAFVEAPTVHPINLVTEGGSMTVLCIAMGTPTPTISLYISGRLVRQEVTRHMVTVINNVTRDMDQIACYGDNGYGTPMQASRKIVISHPPHITASVITMAAPGDSVSLECLVQAQPEPKMMFWRDHNGRVPVIQGGRYDINIAHHKEEGEFTMRLTIHKVERNDAGDFFCHAENAFGAATQPVSLRVRMPTANPNMTACCMDQNVSSACMDACSFYMDLETVIDRPACIHDFDRLVLCAADGADHRSCCARAGVPRRCLDWCRGEPLLNSRLCLLQHTKTILSCFHNGRERLPGPPQNVRVEAEDSHTVRVRWDVPLRNPLTADIYRVVWRERGVHPWFKNDTHTTSLRIVGLKEGVLYECAVAAGNRLGASAPSPSVFFTVGARDKYITSAASVDSEGSHAGVAVGAVLAVVALVSLAAAAVWYMRRRRLLCRKSSGGVAFENPSYLREMNMDHIQNPSGQSDTSTGDTGSASPAGTTGLPAAAGMSSGPDSGAGSDTGTGTVAGKGAGSDSGTGTVIRNGITLASAVASGFSTLSRKLSPALSPTLSAAHLEALHVPHMSHVGHIGRTAAEPAEVTPSLHEELKLGRGGAGFKRFK